MPRPRSDTRARQAAAGRTAGPGPADEVSAGVAHPQGGTMSGNGQNAAAAQAGAASILHVQTGAVVQDPRLSVR